MNKVQELLEAVKKNQHTEIRRLLGDGVDVNAKYGQVKYWGKQKQIKRQVSMTRKCYTRSHRPTS